MSELSALTDDDAHPTPRFVITLTDEEWEQLKDRSKHLVLHLVYLGQQLDVWLQRGDG